MDEYAPERQRRWTKGVLFVLFALILCTVIWYLYEDHKNTSGLEFTQTSEVHERESNLANAPDTPTEAEKFAPPKMVTITYTDDGFQPAVSHLSPGDTVQFVNESSTPIWPISTDDEGRAFDARGNIGPGESFSLGISLPGAFQYHNKYSPNHVGVVSVE